MFTQSRWIECNHDLGALVSENGILYANLSYLSSIDGFGDALYCYLTPTGIQSPVFRVNPGDQLNIVLENNLPLDNSSSGMEVGSVATACGSRLANKASTNIHYHGTYTSPKCHQDAVVYTLIDAKDSFTYNLFFPQNHPPGLYAYHPHVHGVAEQAVLGGATGAIIVEGIENYQPAVAGLPEKILIIRDSPVVQDSSNDNAPGKDLSINYIPIRYPSYEPALLQIKPLERQFFRVLNAAADTAITLELQYDGTSMPLEIVAVDGVPLDNQTTSTQYQISIGPMGRAEFIITGPSLAVAKAQLLTLANDNGLLGAHEPERPLLELQANPKAEAPSYVIPEVLGNHSQSLNKVNDLLAQAPNTTRTLYFSESISWPFNSNDPVSFYITVDGHDPVTYDPNLPPAITTKIGSVEDWIIENRALETPCFFISISYTSYNWRAMVIQ